MTARRISGLVLGVTFNQAQRNLRVRNSLTNFFHTLSSLNQYLQRKMARTMTIDTGEK
jgi:hypothetical protein